VGKALNLVVLGLIAGALMLVAKLGLSRLSLPNYPTLSLSGHEGLQNMGINLALGAGFALLFGFLVKPVLPSGVLLAALVFSALPFVFFAMALPMWQGRPTLSDPWQLLYMELHLFIFSLALVLLGKGGGGGSKE
jgi:hypothetical protein